MTADSSPPGSLLTFRKPSPGSICMSSLTWGSNFDFWLRHIASPPHLTCLSKPSQRETKPPSNTLLLSLDLSLATRLPLLSCWRCLTRHDVQLERMFAFTLLLRAAQCVSVSQPRELCVVQCPLPMLSSLLTTGRLDYNEVSGIIMASVRKQSCKCWVKGNDQYRTLGPSSLQTATSSYL